MARLSAGGENGNSPGAGTGRLIRLNLLFYFVQYSSISFTLVLGQSLFLKKAGPEFLPASFIALNLLLVAFEFILLALDRIPEFGVLVFSIAAGTAYTLFCNCLLFQYDHYLIYFLYFVFGYIFVVMTLFGYLTYFNGLLPLRAQKAWSPYIHGASSLGAVVSGFSLKYLLEAISVSGVLHIIVILNVISLGLVFAIESSRGSAPDENATGGAVCSEDAGSADENDGDRPEAAAGEIASAGDYRETPSGGPRGRAAAGVFSAAAGRFRESFEYAASTPLAFYLIVITFIVNFKEAMIDFVFSSRMAEEFASVDQMASFSGTFRAVNMLFVMFAQFFVLKPFLGAFSVSAAMMVMPLAIIPSSAAGIIFYFFSTVVALKFFHEISVKCFNRPAVGIFNNAMAGRKTKMFVFYEISAYSSKVLAGLALFLLKPFAGTYFFIYMILFASAVYVYFAFRLEPAYIGALESNLKDGSLDDKIKAINQMGYIPAGKAMEALAGILKTGSAPERLEAIKKIAGFEGSSRLLCDALSRETDPAVVATIIARLASDPGMEAAITSAMAGNGNEEFRLRMDALLGHENRRVRANFIEGFANFSSGKNTAPVSARLSRYLADPDFRVRSSAIISVSRLSEDESELKTAMEGLYDMSVSGDAKARASAAYVMGRLKSPAFIAALAKLAADGDAGVRKYSAMALANNGGAAVEEILRGRLSIEKDAGVRGALEESLAAVAGEGRAEIANLLKSHSVEFRNRVLRIMSGLDLGRFNPLISRILLLEGDELKIEALKGVSRYGGDQEYYRFLEEMTAAPAGAEFEVFEKAASARGFRLEKRYLELYGAAAASMPDGNRAFIKRLIAACLSRSDKTSARAVLELILECAAISSGDYEGAMKKFRAALSPDAAISSYAAELIENVLDRSIAGDIATLIEKHRES